MSKASTNGQAPGLVELAARFAEVAADHPDLASRARTIAERTERQQLHLAVCGEFKRGKSTLVNALLGTEVLPTGALPLTAIATELSAGPSGVVVTLQDGATRNAGIDDLRIWATEDGNPGNERQVARVQVQVPSSFLDGGLVLVDTPGAGSVHGHNTKAAETAWDDADGAVLVVSADAPLSDAERQLFDRFTERDATVFVVLNKVDHLEPDDITRVSDFIGEAAGRPGLMVWAVSARNGLPRRTDDSGQFDELRAAIRRFVEHDLLDERGRVTRNELRALAERLRTRLEVEVAAAGVEADRLAELLGQFATAARAERDRFDADKLLLERRSAELCQTVADELRADLAQAASERRADVATMADSLDRRDLEGELRSYVEEIVREELDRARPMAVRKIDAAWQALAEQLRDGTEARINTVRAVAAELFEVDMPAVQVPSVAEVDDRFSFLFLPSAADADQLNRLGRMALPTGVRRRRAAALAVELLARELDKHAGRARVDLRERMTEANAKFVEDLGRQLDAAIADIQHGAASLESTMATAVEVRAERGARAGSLRGELENIEQAIDAPDGVLPRQASQRS